MSPKDASIIGRWISLPANPLVPPDDGKKVRVLEIGGYAAAYCGRLWVRSGADVVRVAPKTMPPAWVSQQALQAFTDSGKRVVQATHPADIAELAARADVVVCEAATADELTQLGFEHWPTQIKLAITPFGLTGPRRNWRATPSVLLAMGGYTNMIGDPDRPPLNLPGHYTEFQTGAVGYAVAQAAWFSDSSDRIDIGMLEVIAALHHYTTVRYQADGQIRQRRGSDLWFVMPSDLFKCRDGWAYLTITPSFWEMFVLLLDRPELLLDEKFADNDARMENRDALREIIAENFAALTCAELEEKAAEFRVPLGIAQTPAEVLADGHLAERQFWENIELASGKTVQSPGLPWRGQAPYPAPEPPDLLQEWTSVW